MEKTRTNTALRDSVVAVFGVILIAANLRAAVSGLSPIYDIVDADVPLGIEARALLGSLPPLGFVLGGLITPGLTRRIGLEWNLVTLVGIMTVGHVIRAVAHDWTVLALGSAIALIGSGMGNVSLPPTIKKYFPDHIGPMSAAYISLLSLGSVVAPLIAVPLSETSSWRVSIVVWAAFAAFALIPWLIEIRAGHNVAVTVEQSFKAKLRLAQSPTAWAITVAFTVSSITGYAMFAWLPDIAQDVAHKSALESGFMLALFAFAGTPASLAMPLIAARIRKVGWLVGFGGMLILVGFGGMLFAPTAAPYLWVVLFGAGPLLFPLSLALINLRTQSTSASLQLSAFVQSIAYSVAAFAPPLMGWSRAVTGSWTIALIGLSLSGLGAAWAAVILARGNTIESELRN